MSHTDSLVRCHHCDYTGHPQLTIETELVDSMYDRPPTTQVYDVSRCPNCASENVTEVFYCENCLIRVATEEGTDLCKVCYAEQEAEQDANVKRIKELEDELRGSL